MSEPAEDARRPTSRRRRRRWPWIVGLLVVVGAGLLIVRRGGAGPKDIDQSLVVKVKRADLEISVIETGKVQPREKVEVKSKVAGQVARVFVEEGQAVKKGQLLLRIDATDFRRDVASREADVGKTQADLAQAKNGLEFARMVLERRKRGLEGRGVMQADVDLADNEVKSKAVAVQTAEAVLSGAKVALGASQDRLRYTEILSSMDGTVIQRGIEPGEVVTPGVQATFEGKALLTVADLSTLLVRAELNQIDVAKVKMGQKVTLNLDALPGKEYQATITKIAPASTTPKGKDVDVFPVEATLTQVDVAIRPGMTADVKIHIETRHQVLVLPIEAVVKGSKDKPDKNAPKGAVSDDKDKDKSFVTRVVQVPGGKPRTERIEVKVGARNDRELEVISGIAEGDQVLIKPASSAENEFNM